MLRLVKLTAEYRPQLDEMMDEWTQAGEKIVPYAIRKVDYRDFDRYLPSLEVGHDRDESLVPDSTFFCLDTDRNLFVGADQSSFPGCPRNSQRNGPILQFIFSAAL